MENKASVCLCMIAKDEEKNIERCIKSARGLVDEIVVADTGSVDSTAAIARSLGAKIYDYPWDDSFANARNFAMSKAESGWLLLLDADEALDPDGISAIIDFIKTTDLDGAHFRVRNYTGTYSPDCYSLHSALRLLRNSGEYRFRGDIHEQVVAREPGELSRRFTTLPVTIHHYGYLDAAVREKQKRRRNMPILEKQLRENPDEPFILFNMGNEYLSMQDYGTALQYYEKALENLSNKRLAFVPHLYFRVVCCHAHLGRHEQALATAREGLDLYPSCTDFMYLRGDILHRCRRYTLAIEAYEACLTMGNPIPALEFLPGCGTYRAAYQLGEIYRELEDYGRALRNYDLALSHKQNLYAALYRVGGALNQLFPDKDEAARKLFACFADPKYAPNALLGADILINEGLYPPALAALEGLNAAEGRETELAYVRGRALFYQKQFREALPLLESVCGAPETARYILRGVRPRSALMLFALGLMEGGAGLLEKALDDVRACCTAPECAAAGLMKNIFAGIPQEDPGFPDGGKAELAAMLQILDMILKCREFDLFERMLRALNYVDAKDVLLRLGELYAGNGLPQMAAGAVIRSVKELDYLDAMGVEILLRESFPAL